MMSIFTTMGFIYFFKNVIGNVMNDISLFQNIIQVVKDRHTMNDYVLKY